ncbi:MAG TPA: Rrf2 family transcriptional regulator [Candidatus Acidoferrales bacterium]|nr:Rrf2 family transcriptional regulator [Candidatus Acidoferrales bacterium]
MHTDFALRVLIYLSLRRDRLCQVSEIARDYKISRNHLVKVVNRLARAGFVQTHRGRAGGVALAREPEAIRIGDVLRHTEGAFEPVECFRIGNQCPITPACKLPPILTEAYRNFVATLDRYTIADLTAHRRRLEALLDSR